MKRFCTATEHAATKDKSAKRGRASGTATEHAASKSDVTGFHGPGKDASLETMFREACSKAPANVERLLQEVNATMSPATEQTPGTPTDTQVTVPNSQRSPSMQPSSSAVESGAATEHTAAGAEITTCMKAIVTEWNTLSTDDARDLVNAAQVLLKGDQNDVRNLCKPWGVQL